MTAVRTLVLRPTRGWRSIELRELWAYRELLFIFVWRDLTVRYRQTLLGALWVMGQPLASMLIFSVLFLRVAKLSVGTEVPYPLFVLAGVLLWNFISSTINSVGGSLIGSAYLISKSYFPRLVIPLASVCTLIVDFGIAALLLIPMMIWFRVAPGPALVLFPLIVLFAAMFALGAGLWVAALNIEYRDVRILVPWVLQLAMYVTPVIYPLSALPERYRAIAVLNPAAGIVEGLRATLFDTPVPLLPLVWSIVASVAILISGVFYFKRVERRFADLL